MSWLLDMRTTSPLLKYLADPSTLEDLSQEEFSLLLAEARASGLVGRLASRITDSPAFKSLPKQQSALLTAGLVHSKGFSQDVRRELNHIERALIDIKVPVVVLKGASYVMLDLPPARGRMFSDIDILVPRESVGKVEAALMLGGWATGAISAYDSRYYREWSHEIPPMTHRQRGTTIDLHHALSMPTCRIRIDSARMVADAIQVKNGGFWWRLQDEDMVLHAISHLALNSEFDRGLRDLWDIDCLYRHFELKTPDFAEKLFKRAQRVGLENLLTQVLGLVSQLFATPMPERIKANRFNIFSNLLAIAATTRHPLTRHRLQGLADLLLMWREVYLRLPTQLLVVHMWHKFSELFVVKSGSKA
jgi:hypothetical protein